MDLTRAEYTPSGADSRVPEPIFSTGSDETDPLLGIPQPVRDAVGVYDSDTAGGCG